MGVPTSEHFARSQYTTALTADTRKATSGTAVQLGPMAVGATYVLLVETENAYFLQGASNVTPTSSTGIPIAVGQAVSIYCDVEASNGYVGVITGGSAGVACIAKVT